MGGSACAHRAPTRPLAPRCTRSTSAWRRGAPWVATRIEAPSRTPRWCAQPSSASAFSSSRAGSRPRRVRCAAGGQLRWRRARLALSARVCSCGRARCVQREANGGGADRGGAGGAQGDAGARGAPPTVPRAGGRARSSRCHRPCCARLWAMCISSYSPTSAPRPWRTSGACVRALRSRAMTHAAALSVHSRDGYFDGVIFHRVIKEFMVQTGDPLGACALAVA